MNQAHQDIHGRINKRENTIWDVTDAAWKGTAPGNRREEQRAKNGVTVIRSAPAPADSFIWA
jgi:hypothetical protein